MNKPILYHDLTSEPSRAVYWLVAETCLDIGIEYTWLTQGGHRTPALLESILPTRSLPWNTAGSAWRKRPRSCFISSILMKAVTGGLGQRLQSGPGQTAFFPGITAIRGEG